MVVGASAEILRVSSASTAVLTIEANTVVAIAGTAFRTMARSIVAGARPVAHESLTDSSA